ncbi:MAG: hypothetical protein M5U34_04760 [Chloroflexi bacterium]|nr:hypothetical protein [Chloroflexota bacterium]
MQSDNYEAFKLAGEVAGWAAGIANAIGAVKGLFLSIHSFVTSHKKAPERGVSLLKGILEAGQAGVKSGPFPHQSV